MPLRMLGICCGIGSMMVGAKEMGVEIIGNFEDRKIYHTGTFEDNFQGSFMTKDFSGIHNINNVDVVFGQPKCGSFSSLSKPKDLKNVGCKFENIVKFVEGVQIVKPKIFAMENLPKSLSEFTVDQYPKAFPEYDIFFEHVSNYYYNNAQPNRRRLFIIGAKKELGFVFRPGERPNGKSMFEYVSDLPDRDDIREIGHIHKKPDDIMLAWRPYYIGLNKSTVTLKDLQAYLKKCPLGIIEYHSSDGQIKKRIGRRKLNLKTQYFVLTGGGNKGQDNIFRHDTLNPLTIREMARFMGFPDSFSFSPKDFDRDANIWGVVYQQTGRSVPVEFCRFLTTQIKHFLKGNEFRSSGKRIEVPNPYIDRAKKWYCDNIGYSNQQGACKFCWLECKK